MENNIGVTRSAIEQDTRKPLLSESYQVHISKPHSAFTLTHSFPAPVNYWICLLYIQGNAADETATVSGDLPL